MVASKPYAGSGNYIQKMSDYCSDCTYKVKEKISNDACPLNSLYWQFMEQHRQLLQKNPRISMVFKGWDKRQDKEAVLKRAAWCVEHLEHL